MDEAQFTDLRLELALERAGVKITMEELRGFLNRWGETGPGPLFDRLYELGAPPRIAGLLSANMQMIHDRRALHRS